MAARPLHFTPAAWRMCGLLGLSCLLASLAIVLVHLLSAEELLSAPFWPFAEKESKAQEMPWWEYSADIADADGQPERRPGGSEPVPKLSSADDFVLDPGAARVARATGSWGRVRRAFALGAASLAGHDFAADGLKLEVLPASTTHRQLWRELAQGEQHVLRTESDWALVLEGALMVHPVLRPGQLAPAVEAALSMAESLGVGFVYLGACQPRRVDTAGQALVRTPRLRDLEVVVAASLCLYAYAVQRRVAASLLSDASDASEAELGLVVGRLLLHSRPPVLPGKGGRPVLRRALLVGSNVQHMAWPADRGLIFRAVAGQQAAEFQSCPVFWNPTGRTGNLMFGYASTLGLAARIGADVQINVDCSDDQVSHTCAFLSRYRLPHGVVNERCKMGEWDEERDGNGYGRFDPGFFGVRRGTRVGTYLQSWKYFEGMEEELRMVFAVPAAGAAAARQRMDLLTANATGPTICMQVRREDKATMSDYYLLPDRAWYLQAAKAAMSHLAAAGLDPDAATFVATLASAADQSWVAAVFSGWPRPVVVTQGVDAYADLALLQTACDALIIGQSSFGWWAAFLSPFARVVVAPVLNHPPERIISKQFRVDDYYPPGWVLV